MRIESQKIALFSAISMTALSLAIAPAVAGPGGHNSPDVQPYVSVFAGASLLNEWQADEFDAAGVNHFHTSITANSGYLLGGAIGLKWHEFLRSELELSHNRWSGKNFASFAPGGAFLSSGAITGSVAATYLLGNLWIDWPRGSALTPYAGGGLGAAWVSSDVSNPGVELPSGIGSGLAYQLGLGLQYRLNDKLDLDLGYRFKGIANFTLANAISPGAVDRTSSLTSHNIQLGLTFRF